MERMNPFPGSLSSACTGGQEPLSSSSSSPYFSQWNSSSSCSPVVVELGSKGKGKGNAKPARGSDFHHRSPSDTFFMEGQLSWLDDLLNEPDTLVVPKGHRRAASDTFAYVGANIQAFDTWEDLPYNKGLLASNSHTSMWAQDIVNFKSSNEAKLDKKPPSFEDKNKKDSNAAVCGSVERHEIEESRPPTSEGCAEGASSSSQAKPSLPKTEARRNKQQSAHRSRVRKLQYIAHLERTVQVLQSTGTKMSAELEFLDNQNMILNMENRALKQRLDSVSQEQLIKQFEHDMLERELGRLQTVCRLQEQEQMLMHQQQQNPRNRRPKSKDASAFRGQVNSQVQT